MPQMEQVRRGDEPRGDFQSRGGPPVGSLLDRAARAERRRVFAWLLASGLTAATALVMSSPAAFVAAAVGLALAVWSGRQAIGILLARRDFHRADTPPRRAHVALVDDPNPRAIRPLLAIWVEGPTPGERLAKADSVWRCDDELDELESTAGSVVLHEAWVDTGPRRWSKPRWVRADAGIALPHRRALFGRWYVKMILRSDRPGEARPLTLDDPHAELGLGEELALEGGLLGSVAWRVVLLAAFAVLVEVLG